MTMETLTETRHPSTGSADNLAHIVSEAGMLESFVAGTELEALCGKRWVPSREGSGLPICGECKALFDGFGFEWGGTRKEEG